MQISLLKYMYISKVTLSKYNFVHKEFHLIILHMSVRVENGLPILMIVQIGGMYETSMYPSFQISHDNEFHLSQSLIPCTML